MTDIPLAYKIAMDLEKPIVRLCADIDTGEPMEDYMFENISKQARIKIKNGDSVFSLGGYSAFLIPEVKEYLRKQGLTYSDIALDGVHRNGKMNIALWMTRPELEIITPKRMEEIICGNPGIKVMERLSSHDQIPDGFVDLSKLVNSKPLIARLYFDDGKDYRNTEQYTEIPPYTWGFYGEKPAPERILRFMEAIRSGERELSEEDIEEVIKNIHVIDDLREAGITVDPSLRTNKTNDEN